VPALNQFFSKSHHQKDITVNLLPRDAFTNSTIGHILTWSLSTGRYIVVFTEMIVILTFLSRFTLDRKLTDLNETILKQQAVVESFGDLEPKVRNIQKKTEFIRQFNSRVKVLDLLDFLDANTPETITLDKLSVRADSFSLESVAYSPLVLNTFVNTLRGDPRFSDVSLGQISTTEKESGISFSISAQFNNQ